MESWIVGAQHHAEEQRVRADDSRNDAEDLLSFMLVNLRDKLKPLGKVKLLDEVATKAVAYYDRRGLDLGDAELLKRALARRNLGDVLSMEGDANSALREFRASLEIDEALVAKDPSNTAVLVDVALSREKIGNVVRPAP